MQASHLLKPKVPAAPMQLVKGKLAIPDGIAVEGTIDISSIYGDRKTAVALKVDGISTL